MTAMGWTRSMRVGKVEMRIRAGFVAAAVVAAGIGGAGAAEAVADDTILVSRAGGFGPKANGDSQAFGGRSFSADGRFVAFASQSDNLHADDTDTTDDIFVRDLASDTTSLVSRATGGSGDKGDGGSSTPVVSADGRFVAFRSLATNLHPDDLDDDPDIFVRDLAANTTTLVSRATDAAGDKGNGASGNPSISADGSFVGFASIASNLHPDDLDANVDVFVRDLAANTTTLVSRATGASGDKSAGFFAALPSISADGRFVAFYSDADNLHPDDTDTADDVFVRDLAANTTTLVSRATGVAGNTGNGASVEPAISADGRFVAFHSFASNLHPDDLDANVDIFVRDLAANTTTLVSRATGASGDKSNSISGGASISADGRFVAFTSGADNLHPDDTDASLDVFARDVRGPQPPPALSIGNVKAKEGNKGTKPFTFTVTLDGVPGRTVTVDFATKNGTATLADNDYLFTNGTLTFLPGVTTHQIVVDVVGDKKKEKNETFKVKLFNPSGAEIEDPTGIGTIKNDDKKKR